ncbi:hypothetical protein ES705_35258 [subsurface metagenome]
MKTITASICITIIAVAAIATGYDGQIITGSISTLAALGAYAVGARRAKRPPPPTPPRPTGPPEQF